MNCAGFAAPKKFENSTLEEERRQMDVNYFGSTQVTRAVLPDMKANNSGGHIVFVASQAGLIGLFGLSSYCASKFAIRGFAESLAMGRSRTSNFCEKAICLFSLVLKLNLRFKIEDNFENYRGSTVQY